MKAASSLTRRGIAGSRSSGGKPPLPGLQSIAARKPPQQANPSMISQLSKQRHPITLAKVSLVSRDGGAGHEA